jgi:purine nucleosidase
MAAMTLEKRRIILDCDPGQDDAVNLLLAIAARDALDILGVTAVAGNVPLDLGEKNARRIVELAGAPEIRVFAGCPRPMARALVTAHHVHGTSGIDGMTLFEPRIGPQPRHAVDFIVETLLAAEPASVTLVPTGPLTNVAMALVKEPRIADCIKEIVLMGGAMREGGNITPSAEFNIFVDPHAAETVFKCGRPIAVIGLDATHQVLCSRVRVDRIRAIGGPVAEAVYGMLSFFNRHDSAKYGVDGAPLHDPCTVAYLLAPSLFTAKPCRVEVETSSPLTLGHTAVDFWGVTGEQPNALWVHGVDADGFFTLLTDRLSRLVQYPAAVL